MYVCVCVGFFDCMYVDHIHLCDDENHIYAYVHVYAFRKIYIYAHVCIHRVHISLHSASAGAHHVSSTVRKLICFWSV